MEHKTAQVKSNAIASPEAFQDDMKWVEPKHGEIIIATVGGVGQIGMNMTLYGTEGRYVIVDAGVGFTQQDVRDKTGVAGHIVDISSLDEIIDKIDGLILTHAHEDHVGGVVEVLNHIDLPVYATPLGINILERKIKESNLDYSPELIQFNPGDSFRVGNLNIETGSMSHSIPECAALFVSADGVDKGVFHTADYNMDPNPSTGYIDRNFLKRLGDEDRVAVVVGDSTNVMREEGGSEADVAKGIKAIMESEKGGIFFVCFASNIGRMATIAQQALEGGRQVAVMGRSMKNFAAAGRELGYLDGIPEFIDAQDLDNLPQNERVGILTGTQGEPQAALARMLNKGGTKSGHDTRFPKVTHGDVIVVSGRTIDGNQKQVREILDGYRRIGINVIEASDSSNGYPIHVSGHASKAEINELYDLIKPDIIVPVHGEDRHMVAHAELAMDRKAGFLLPTPGSILRLDNDGLEHVGHIKPVIKDIMEHGYKNKPKAPAPGM